MKKGVFFLLLLLTSCGSQTHKTRENPPEHSSRIPKKNMFPLHPSLSQSPPLFSSIAPREKPQEPFDRSIIRGKEFLFQKELLYPPATVRDFDAGILATSFDSEPVSTCQTILQALLKGQQKENLYSERWRLFLSKILSKRLKENQLTAYRLGLPIPLKKDGETKIPVLLQNNLRRAIVIFFFSQQKEGWRLTDVQGDWNPLQNNPISSPFDPEEPD